MYRSNSDKKQSEQVSKKLAFEKELLDEVDKPGEAISIEKLKKMLDEIKDKPLTEKQKEALNEIGRILFEITRHGGSNESS